MYHTAIPQTLLPGDLAKAIDAWRQAVLVMRPMANADFVRQLCEDIVKRAHLLSEQSRLRFVDVAIFLLDRSRAWVIEGLPLDQIGGKMPKTLSELGMMKLAEGSVVNKGQPLTPDELLGIKRNFKPIIIN